MNNIVDTLIVREINVLGLKKNYLLKQILCSLIFLDKTLVDMHASAFLYLLLLPFFHGVCVIFVCLNCNFWKKMCHP